METLINIDVHDLESRRSLLPGSNRPASVAQAFRRYRCRDERYIIAHLSHAETRRNRPLPPSPFCSQLRTSLDTRTSRFCGGRSAVLVTLGYLANMGDTDTIAADIIDTEVPGMSISAGINVGHLSLIGEYISALDEFQSGDGNIDYQLNAEAQPRASNFELAYAMGTTALR